MNIIRNIQATGVLCAAYIAMASIGIVSLVVMGLVGLISLTSKTLSA